MTMGRRVPDDTLIEAVREAAREGATDFLDGGVPAEEVARRTPVAERTARDRLAGLADRGRLRRVQGANPDSKSYEARSSYLPLDGEARDC